MQEQILIVDDEQEIADLVALYLENKNFKVFKYYTAQDGLNCVAREQLDLAILDVMLPDIDGFTLCQRIREDHLYPIIMLTAKVEDMDKITGLTLGQTTILQSRSIRWNWLRVSKPSCVVIPVITPPEPEPGKLIPLISEDFRFLGTVISAA